MAVPDLCVSFLLDCARRSLTINGKPNSGSVALSIQNIKGVQSFLIDITFNPSLFVPVPNLTVSYKLLAVVIMDRLSAVLNVTICFHTPSAAQSFLLGKMCILIS